VTAADVTAGVGGPDPDAEYRLLIGGESVEAGNGTYAIVNPATERVVGHAPNASAADAEAAAAAASRSGPSCCTGSAP
jgi:acyl-CoA reductase-like NAD-dependent aldehyde dehydrogenase